MKVSLKDIIARRDERDFRVDRIASFEVCGDRLVIMEECDEYFSAALTVEDIDKLIGFLTVKRAEVARNADPPDGHTVEGRPFWL